MASYTDNYALTKPTMAESADIRVINSNMDTVDDVLHSTQISLAPAYDLNETYNTGDVVMYELLMYECLEDDVTGAWDATKWQRTTAGEHGGGSDVEVTQIQTEGKAVASIAVDGVSTDILIPELKVYGEATGDLITIDDAMKAPLEECKVTLEPQQAGTGDPSPENVRPISGWSAVNVTRCGKNLFDRDSIRRGVYTKADGTTQSGSATTNFSSQFIKIMPNTTYSITMFGESYENGSLFGIYYDENKNGLNQFTNIIRLVSNESKTFTTPSNAYYIVFTGYRGSGTDIFTTANTMVCEGTPTTYEPYNGHTYNIQFKDGDNPLTVYGGTLDVISGVLTVDRAYVDLGAITWSYTNERFYYNPTNAKVYTLLEVANLLCSQYPTSKYSSQADNSISSYSGYIYVRADLYSGDTTAFKTAMNGVQLVYELATPQEIQLTPTEVILLRGINNIWSDGEMYVKYRRDIEMLLQRIADSLGGNA